MKRKSSFKVTEPMKTSKHCLFVMGISLAKNVLGGSKLYCGAEMLPGKKCWGDKIVKVPTASEASKLFADYTSLISSKFHKTL